MMAGGGGFRVEADTELGFDAATILVAPRTWRRLIPAATAA